MEIKGSSDCVEGERNEDSSHSKIDFRLESEAGKKRGCV